MGDSVVVSVRDLRQAMQLLLDAIERRFGSEADLDADHYWAIDPKVAFELGSPDLAGAIWTSQLSDDVQELRALLQRDGGPAVWHDFSHVAGVLRRIAALDL